MEKLLSQLKNTNTQIAGKDWTFLGVGGFPIFTFFPQSLEEIEFFIKNKPQNLQYRTFGAGSNILIRDKGYDGVFIRLHKTFNKIYLQNDILIVEAGVNFVQLLQFCIKNELGGLEFLSTIPGQIGGWTKMNAGIPEKELKDVLIWAECINENGILIQLSNEECKFKYRSSIFKNNWIITKIALKTTKKDRKEIEKEVKILKQYRKTTQPTIGKLAGCFFKNYQKEIKAWQLIDKTNLKSCGQTYISELHQNFLVADQSKNAAEIEYFIEVIRANILYNQSIFLDSEIERIGTI